MIQVVQHGGCLGLGLAAMGTANSGTTVLIHLLLAPTIIMPFFVRCVRVVKGEPDDS